MGGFCYLWIETGFLGNMRAMLIISLLRNEARAYLPYQHFIVEEHSIFGTR